MSKLPIKTFREGNKITKICVEDIYKILNRVIEQMDKSYNNSMELIDAIEKEVDDYEGSLIVGTGVSEPCITDAFDEEIGENIAFMKCKLNANLKKRNLLLKVYFQYMKVLNVLDTELSKIEKYIDLDLKGIRLHNPDYLKHEV